MLADNAYGKNDEIDKEQRKKLFTENSMRPITPNYKTFISTSNMVTEFRFLWRGKIGSYYMEFDDKQIVKKRLDYTLSKNRSMFFEITVTAAKYNSSVFSGDFLSDVKDLKKKYWGKHTLMSILYHMPDTYSEEYAISQFNGKRLQYTLYFGKNIW